MVEASWLRSTITTTMCGYFAIILNAKNNLQLPSKSSQLQLQPHGSLTFRNLRSFPHLKLEAKMQMSPHNNMMMKSKPEAQKNVS
jgi:hypothetical protein